MMKQEKKLSIYDEIRLNSKDYNAKNSYTWFMNSVRKMATGNVGPMRMLGDNIKQQKNRFLPGHMYMFTYSPIHKDTLPYYDKFPLVFPFSIHGKYITGLNLHYVHPKIRLLILNELMTLRNTNGINNRTLLRLSWSALKRMSKFPQIAKCVKQYHISHVKSMMLMVEPNDWPMAIFLPLERFEKATANKVWSM